MQEAAVGRNGRVRIQAGDTIFQQGDPGECAYLVESGTVRVIHRLADGQSRAGQAGMSDMLGEMALVDSSPRSSTAIAESDTVLIPVSRETIRHRLESADPLTRTVMSALVRRLREMLDPTRLMPPAVRATRLRSPVADELGMVSGLQDALSNDLLEARFQPIVACNGLEPAGFETLLRFRRGYEPGCPVSRIIEVAEHSGLIDEIGIRMLRAARGFRDRLNPGAVAEPHLFVSVNVSTEQLDKPHASRDLVTDLRRNGGSGIHLEITESAFAGNPARLRRLLGHLQRTGARLSLDDFGTGYSSIGYLNRFPLELLKIDRSFVSAMERSAMSFKLVRAIATLGRELGIETVAEGVESGDQLRLVRDAGCHYAQGFYFSPALPADRAMQWLRCARPDRPL